MNERVSFVTDDGVTIVGDYYEGGRDKAAILLHMMPATRASWTALANILTLAGLSVLAIDLRGHGESVEGTNGNLLDYKNFNDRDHQESMRDVIAAVEFLKKRKMKLIALGGASIGANLALTYGANHSLVESLALLSPGLLYRGVNVEEIVARCSPKQRAFFLASEEDEYSAASTRELYEKFPGEKRLEIFRDAGHGTTILERKPEFLKEVSDWLSK